MENMADQRGRPLYNRAPCLRPSSPGIMKQFAESKIFQTQICLKLSLYQIASSFRYLKWLLPRVWVIGYQSQSFLKYHRFNLLLWGPSRFSAESLCPSQALELHYHRTSPLTLDGRCVPEPIPSRSLKGKPLPCHELSYPCLNLITRLRCSVYHCIL